MAFGDVNAAKALTLYIVVYDRAKNYALVTAWGSEDALDLLAQDGIDLDWGDVTSVRSIQRNVDGPRGLISFGKLHVQCRFRDHRQNRKALVGQLDGHRNSTPAHAGSNPAERATLKDVWPAKSEVSP